MRISDWSSDVCSSDLRLRPVIGNAQPAAQIGAADVVPGGAKLADQLADAREGGFHRAKLGKLAADVDRNPQRVQPRQPGGKRIGIQRAADRHTELVLGLRSEEHTSELQSLMRISYAVFFLKKKTINKPQK